MSLTNWAMLINTIPLINWQETIQPNKLIINNSKKFFFVIISLVFPHKAIIRYKLVLLTSARAEVILAGLIMVKSNLI